MTQKSVVAIVLCGLLGAPTWAASPPRGELLVQHIPNFFLQSTAPPWVPVTADVGLWRFDPEGMTDDEAMAAAAATAGVTHVEKNQTVVPLELSEDWAHRDLRSTQSVPALPGLPAETWSYLSGPGRRAIRIGLIDSGVDSTHPDLVGRVHGGVNLLYDPNGASPEARDPRPMDFLGHGTALAGIMAANRNSFGINGLDDKACIVPIKVFSADGTGQLSDVLRALQWATQAHLQVVNMSFGVHEPSRLLAKAVARLAKIGPVLVAAAGNDGNDSLQWPAALPAVLAVGALSNNEISRFSNRHADIAFYAPGDNLVSLAPAALGPNVYGPISGTSVATAYVSGLLSALLSTGMASQDALQTMRDTALPHLNHAPGSALEAAHTLATATKIPHGRLHALVWRASPQVRPGERIEVMLELANVGNAPSAPSTLSLELQHGSGFDTLPLGNLGRLRPGEHRVFERSLRLPSAPEATPDQQYSVAVRLRGQFANGETSLEVPPVDVMVQPTAQPRLSVKQIGLTANQQTMHVQIANLGNAASLPHSLRGLAIGAVHEGIWQTAALPVTGTQRIKSLAPGQHQVITLPLQAPLPDGAELTLLVEISRQHTVVERAIHSFIRDRAGQARLYYSQQAHMASVETALNLLALQNINIPDVHGKNAPYRGSAQTARDFGSAISIGASRWQWDWQRDWPVYPQSAKTVVDGSSAADGIDIAFGDSGTAVWDTHYWIVDGDDDQGMANRSALTKILALLLGGHGSSIADGAIAAYRAGDKARAWWMVGHAAHLLGDISTGAHTINRNWHGLVGDPYHDWMSQAEHQAKWPASVVFMAGGMLNPYRVGLTNGAAQLRFLSYTTAQIGASFPWHRSRNWLPSGDHDKGDGDRLLGGDLPHYDDYLQAYFSAYPDHPKLTRDLTHDEVEDSLGRCVAVTKLRPGDTRKDCWDGGDGHIDLSNLAMADGDGDLSRIADRAYTHAVRAMAGLFYLFARETGQIDSAAEVEAPSALLEPAGSAPRRNRQAF